MKAVVRTADSAAANSWRRPASSLLHAGLSKDSFTKDDLDEMENIPTEEVTNTGLSKSHLKKHVTKFKVRIFLI